MLAANLGFVAVSGLGVLGAGQKPLDLLVVLAAEFKPPIQLSFGFTLVGVGGIVGINRGPDQRRLSEAVSSGALSDLLFPRDPVADADRLLPQLSACFPRRAGGFVVGPMLKLGWGTPPILAATVAVLVADDAVIVLGRVALGLPAEGLELIHLEALVEGRVDARGLAIDATLAHSRIVTVPIEGDMRLRVQGGERGLFAFSAGGFNPAFEPPEGMSGMRRLSAHVSPGPIFDARLEAYLAVTPAAVQFGARVDLTAGVAGFGIRGWAAFDALFVFEPHFRFDAHFAASVSIECADFSVAGASLDARLSGPAPWRVRGHATVSLLWWDVSVDVPEITWGSGDTPSLPPARDPLAVLAAQLPLRENWTATNDGVPHLVHLAPALAAGEAGVHPLAELVFRQHAVPLQTPLARMDGAHLPERVSLSVAHGEATWVTLDAEQQEPFVPRQFFEVDDTTQRSSAGFQRLPAGFALADPVARTGAVVEHDEQYETLVLDAPGQARPLAASWPGFARAVAGTGTAPPGPGPAVTLGDPAEMAVAWVNRLEAADVAPGARAALAASRAREAGTQLVAAWELA